MHTTGDIKQLTRRLPGEAGFPDAPPGWSMTEALDVAEADGLYLSEAHWEVVRALQSYFGRHQVERGINMRELHDALEERFHARGGLRYLYRLFPGGPLAQGCRIAGLEVPPLAADRSFGSVA